MTKRAKALELKRRRLAAAAQRRKEQSAKPVTQQEIDATLKRMRLDRRMLNGGVPRGISGGGRADNQGHAGAGFPPGFWMSQI